MTTRLPLLPAELLVRRITLRHERSEDGEFLRALYASVRWEEISPLPWSDAAKLGFLAQQCAFQRQHYRTAYAGAACGIAELAGSPIGRLYLHRGDASLRIVDISLLAAHRSRGIGGGLLRAVIAQAAQQGARLCLNVDPRNTQARRLYERLGFAAREGGAGGR